MSKDITTKPTIETVLERIDNFSNRVDERFQRVDERFQRMDERMEELEKEMHRIASLAHKTREEMVAFRIDFKELRAQVTKVLPDTQSH